MSKSKILLAALLPFLFLQSSFAGVVVDAKKDNRRLAGLSYVGKKTDAAKSGAVKSAATNQTAPRRK